MRTTPTISLILVLLCAAANADAQRAIVPGDRRAVPDSRNVALAYPARVGHGSEEIGYQCLVSKDGIRLAWRAICASKWRSQSAIDSGNSPWRVTPGDAAQH